MNSIPIWVECSKRSKLSLSKLGAWRIMHVHVLILFPRTMTVAEMVRETKRASTTWVRGQKEVWKNFHWQGGYGAFSVSPSKAEDVVAYIRNQEEHHQRVTFQDEYRARLKKHAVKFEEKYVWD